MTPQLHREAERIEIDPGNENILSMNDGSGDDDDKEIMNDKWK